MRPRPPPHLCSAGEELDEEVVLAQDAVGGDAGEEALELGHGGVEGDGRLEGRDDALGAGVAQRVVEPLEVPL